MFSIIANNKKEIEYVIENLCFDTVVELKALFGDIYKEVILNEINKTATKYLIKLKSTEEPVGLFGLLPQGNKSAGIFLLTTDNLYKGNKILFLKRAKEQIKN